MAGTAFGHKATAERQTTKEEEKERLRRTEDPRSPSLFPRLRVSSVRDARPKDPRDASNHKLQDYSSCLLAIKHRRQRNLFHFLLFSRVSQSQSRPFLPVSLTERLPIFRSKNRGEMRGRGKHFLSLSSQSLACAREGEEGRGVQETRDAGGKGDEGRGFCRRSDGDDVLFPVAATHSVPRIRKMVSRSHKNTFIEAHSSLQQASCAQPVCLCG